MSYKQDLTGKLFGDSLKVIKKTDIRYEHVYWLCKCEVCGDEKIVRASALNNGSSVNCNECYQETRWTIPKVDRLELCVDYLSGMKNRAICEKYNIDFKNKSLIYKVLKSQDIKSHRSTDTTKTNGKNMVKINPPKLQRSLHDDSSISCESQKRIKEDS